MHVLKERKLIKNSTERGVVQSNKCRVALIQSIYSRRHKVHNFHSNLVDMLGGKKTLMRNHVYGHVHKFIVLHSVLQSILFPSQVTINHVRGNTNKTINNNNNKCL